jgi:cytoskeletal protein CcmA (bactofilin family)
VDERRVAAWIGRGVAIEGNITSTQDLRIDGTVKGAIEVGGHTLTVGAGAAITANVVAKSVLINGSVIGNVTASERIELQATGSVQGDLTSPRVVMAEGAHVQGKIAGGATR